MVITPFIRGEETPLHIQIHKASFFDTFKLNEPLSNENMSVRIVLLQSHKEDHLIVHLGSNDMHFHDP